MATLKIDPIVTQSLGGWNVTLTGIDVTSHDFIIGVIVTPGLGPIEGQWNDSGLRRGGNSPTDSLDIKAPVIADLISTGKKLGAP